MATDLHHFQINGSDSECPEEIQVLMDGKVLKGVLSLRLDIARKNVPVVILEMAYGQMNANVQALVNAHEEDAF